MTSVAIYSGITYWPDLFDPSAEKTCRTVHVHAFARYSVPVFALPLGHGNGTPTARISWKGVVSCYTIRHVPLNGRKSIW